MKDETAEHLATMGMGPLCLDGLQRDEHIARAREYRARSEEISDRAAAIRRHPDPDVRRSGADCGLDRDEAALIRMAKRHERCAADLALRADYDV